VTRRNPRRWVTEAGDGEEALTPAAFLDTATPAAWFDAALEQQELLLLDHANCEKKAASTALALMFAYAEDSRLARQLSRLAREELRHFEQVQTHLDRMGVAFRRLRPSRYAEHLRAVVTSAEPGRRLDLLLCGALIEARSCERFAGLVPRLEEPLAGFYRGLQASESRHFLEYLDAARRHAEAQGLDLGARLEVLARIEGELAVAPDTQFRFHSGPPGV